MICNFCKKEAYPNDKYCGYCGEYLSNNSDDNNSKWYYADNSGKNGPFTILQIKEKISDNKINKNTLVCKDDNRWDEAYKTELKNYFQNSNLLKVKKIESEEKDRSSSNIIIKNSAIFTLLCVFGFIGAFSFVLLKPLSSQDAKELIDVSFLLQSSTDINTFKFTNESTKLMKSLCIFKNNEEYPFITIESLMPEGISSHHRSTYIPKLTLADKIRVVFTINNRKYETHYFLAGFFKK